MKLQRISPCLWFNDNAEEAVKFYTSIFKNSQTKTVVHNGDSSAVASGQKKGTVLTIAFELDGLQFMALNGGPQFKFNHAISLVVNCESQEEIDYYWEKLSAGGGTIEQCGWLADKFGVSWQVVPASLSDWMKDDVKSERVMKEVLKMKKLDMNKLEKAYES